MKRIISGIVIVLIIVVGGYFLWKSTPAKTATSVASTTSEVQTTQAAQADQAAQAKILLEQLSKLMILPQGEQPIIATINDASALIKEQPFYTGAINGDVVFIFQNAAKAIVFSPSRNLIVNVGPILPPAQSQTSSPATTSSTTKKK